MEYYIVDESMDPKVVGTDFPQVYQFIKGYDPHAPHALCSLYDYVDTFPDYTPELDGLRLSRYAKLTDFVSGGFSSFLYIVSGRVKDLLENFHLCPHRFYPLGLYCKGVKHDYFMLQLNSDYSDFVDYPKSKFYEQELFSKKKYGIFEARSKEHLLQERDKMKHQYGYSHTIWGDDIVMSPSFDRELDLFTITRIDASLYVSARLKQAIEERQLTGWNFKPATKLFV